MAFQLPADVLVHQVWQSNFAEEMKLIQRCSTEFHFASIDTDPGPVFRLDAPKHTLSSLSPAQQYTNMKQNVNAKNIIQLGLTLSDSFGNLPRFGSEFRHVWQFNFRDFDSESHLCEPNSISFRNLLQFNHMLNGLTCTF